MSKPTKDELKALRAEITLIRDLQHEKWAKAIAKWNSLPISLNVGKTCWDAAYAMAIKTVIRKLKGKRNE